MTTCNFCMKNKYSDEMHKPLRYVCEDCWDKLVILMPDEGTYWDGDCEVKKEQIY